MTKRIGHGKFTITTKCDSSSSEFLVVGEPAPNNNLTTSDSSLFAHSAVSHDSWVKGECKKVGQGQCLKKNSAHIPSQSIPGPRLLDLV